MSEELQPGLGNERLLSLIEFALREGWSVMRTPSGYIRLSKAGCASIYAGAAAGNRRCGFGDRATWGQQAGQGNASADEVDAAPVSPGDDHD